MEIDWNSAEVRDGTLMVALAGEAPDGWGDYVGSVLERLQRGGERWGDIEVGEERIEVESVTPGAEGDLRHLLESAVLQANSHFAPDKDAEDQEDAASSEDLRMTEQFRSFGDGDAAEE